ncbi:maleylpyruvate isomerase family mycothiol-dependent enzyme [Blastococcus sp. SYSU D00820]
MTDTASTDIATRYAEVSGALLAVLDAVPADAWSRPSPCEGWTARDVVAHLLDTQREFLAGRGIDPGAAPDVAADPAAAWRDHARRVAGVLGDQAVAGAPFEGFFGPTTVGETLDRFYVWDMVVHRWDVARAAGLDAGLTDAELDGIEAGADGFGEALYMEGICRPGPAVGDDAPREARVLARLGRSV